jgi:hypothetical protein
MFQRSEVKAVGASIGISLLCAVTAQAGFLSFDQAGGINPAGIITYDGSGGSLFTSNPIKFDTVRGIDTPFNSGLATTCLGCVLTFTSGPNTLEGAVYEWAGAGLGSFVLTGGLPFITNPVPAGSVLLTGTISIARLTVDEDTIRLRGIDFKHLNLIDFYFGPVNPQFSYVDTNISINGINYEGGCPTCGDGGFSATVTNADIDNVAPEPTTGLLLLLGLGSLAAYRRRKN